MFGFVTIVKRDTYHKIYDLFCLKGLPDGKPFDILISEGEARAEPAEIKKMKAMFKGEEVKIVACSERTTTIQFVNDGYLSKAGEWIYRQLILSNKHHKGSLFIGETCIL